MENKFDCAIIGLSIGIGLMSLSVGLMCFAYTIFCIKELFKK